MQEHAILDAAVTPDRTLTGWASIFIASPVITEVALIELSLGQIVGRMRLGYQDVDPGLFALEDLGTGVIATIS
jgi:hypothetical protein